MTYWDLQTRLVLELNELGMPYKLKDRVPIFKLWRRLDKIEKKHPEIGPRLADIRDLLEHMLAMRRAGMEPDRSSPTRY